MIHSDIKNLLFDFGGVIIDLHVHKTIEQFAALAGKSAQEMSETYGKPEFFFQHEKGLMTDEDFRAELVQYLNLNEPSDKIDLAWNAMLGHLPAHRIHKLEELANTYSLYLLSNTNSIHYQAFTPMVTAATGHASLDELFSKAYYSHEVNMRKPDEEIFVHVLEDSDLRPEETLFLDDTLENLETASKLNIQTFHVKTPDSWLELF